MTSITRRSLVRSAGAAAGAALVGLRPWSAAVAEAAAASHLRRSTYARIRSRRFTATAGGRVVPLRLLRARGSEHAFSLVFAGPAGLPLTGGTYTLRHRRLGAFRLFLTPVGAPGRDVRYEAVVDCRLPLAKARRRAPRRRHRAAARAS
jgi:hypothetical protein